MENNEEIKVIKVKDAKDEVLKYVGIALAMVSALTIGFHVSKKLKTKNIINSYNNNEEVTYSVDLGKYLKLK